MRLIDADHLLERVDKARTDRYGRLDADIGAFIDKEPTIEPINEADLKELRNRFGDYVEFVVRDMLSGQEKRWDEQDIAEADKAYAEYKANPKTYTLIEQKTGRWVVADNKGVTRYYICSECGEAGDITNNFCPNCGVRMDEK